MCATKDMNRLRLKVFFFANGQGYRCEMKAHIYAGKMSEKIHLLCWVVYSLVSFNGFMGLLSQTKVELSWVFGFQLLRKKFWAHFVKNLGGFYI